MLKADVKKFLTTRITPSRITAAMLCLLMVVSTVIPAASAYAEEKKADATTQTTSRQGKPGEIRTTPLADTKGRQKAAPDTKTKMKENYAGALPVQGAKNKPATDYTAKDNLSLPGVTSTETPLASADTLQTAGGTKKFEEKELTDKRTANSETFQNKDGSYTTKRYYASKYYKKSGAWQAIDTTLTEDKNAGDSGNILGRALGAVESWAKDTTTYTVKDNDWQARFAPSGAEVDMVRVKEGGSQVGFSPVGAKGGVVPKITTDKQGNQTVRYENLWPGVDVEYMVGSDQLKENIVLKDKNATNKVQFTFSGGSLKAGDSKGNTTFAIQGALGGDASISPINLILNNFGPVADNGRYTQTYKDGKLTVAVDDSYLAGLPAKAFPAVIDPTVTVRTSAFGTRAGGNYISFKSDGTVCDSTVCNLYAGSLLDSNSVWQYWRGIFFSDYSFLKNYQLNDAQLHLTMRSGVSWYTGTASSQPFSAWRSTCLGFNCFSNYGGVSTFASSGDIDVKPVYDAAIAANDWNSMVMVRGIEGSTSGTTFKNFDPDNSYVTFTYESVLPTPAVTSPVGGSVLVDPVVSFTSTTHANPDSSGPALKYSFCVSGGGNCGGTVMVSGEQSSAQWTIPDGLLEDGATYYVQARTYNPATGVYSPWGAAVSFKVDFRTGKDSTQAYDTLGPVSADLATGNVATSISSHTTSALGGDIGVSLDYNSPLRSRTGLVGQYWNNTSRSGSPALTRVDRNVNFNWAAGSPDSVVSSDSFSAQWDGYFTVPATGDYYFGAVNDDTMSLSINGTQVYSSTSCFNPGPCYASSAVHLTEGDLVPV